MGPGRTVRFADSQEDAVMRSGDNATAWTDDPGRPDPLQPFTSTAQVPAVGRGAEPGFDPRFAPTGSVGAVGRARRAPAPLGLRILLWLVALLLVVAGAGLAVAHLKPAWLSALRVGNGTGSTATTSPPRASSTTAAPSHRSSSGTSHHQTGGVQETSTGSTSATVSVPSAEYTVLVQAQHPCWVQATLPTSATPVFASVVPAGGQQTFHSANGRLALELGASGVTVSVTEAGKSTPAWHFSPAAAPFNLTFTSTAG
jgi:hypothetical protein